LAVFSVSDRLMMIFLYFSLKVADVSLSESGHLVPWWLTLHSSQAVKQKHRYLYNLSEIFGLNMSPQRGTESAKGKWASLSGFVENGQSMQQAAVPRRQLAPALEHGEGV
jgi:hypothetical protein